MSQITKNVWLVLYSGVLTNKSSISVSLHIILPRCSYLKIVQTAEIQTLVSAATVSRREPCLKRKCWFPKPFMLWLRFRQWQFKCWPKCSPASALAQPHGAEQPWAKYLRASFPPQLFPELLSSPPYPVRLKDSNTDIKENIYLMLQSSQQWLFRNEQW